MTDQTYDLIISNFAFSELNKETQDFYLKKYVLNSTFGYMIYNQINPKGFSYTLEEILGLIPKSYLLDEVPLTDPNNRLLLWGP